MEDGITIPLKLSNARIIKTEEDANEDFRLSQNWAHNSLSLANYRIFKLLLKIIYKIR